jgi:hypothetical protein
VNPSEVFLTSGPNWGESPPLLSVIATAATMFGRTINLPAEFVQDNAFPFKVGEELIARIEEGKVIIEKK